MRQKLVHQSNKDSSLEQHYESGTLSDAAEQRALVRGFLSVYAKQRLFCDIIFEVQRAQGDAALP